MQSDRPRFHLALAFTHSCGMPIPSFHIFIAPQIPPWRIFIVPQSTFLPIQAVALRSIRRVGPHFPDLLLPCCTMAFDHFLYGLMLAFDQAFVPAAAIKTGIAECQCLSRLWSECHPFTCIAMKRTK